MGQKVNPVGLRLGIINGWDSNWYGGKNFAEKLVEDTRIRKYISARLPKAGISRVIIERTLKRVTLTINTSRPGLVIGKQFAELDKLRAELKKLTSKDVQINVAEVKTPELDAKLIGETIAQQLEARISYRRAMKQAIAAAGRVGALGIKVKCSGRLGGAEMARTEMYKEGRIPLHTLRADIDYALSEAQTVYGKIGIKVWVFKGEVYGKRDLSPNAYLNEGQTAGGARAAGGNDRRDRNDRGDRGGRGGRGRNDGPGGGGQGRGPGAGGGNNRGGGPRGGQGGGGNRGGNNRAGGGGGRR